MIDKEVTWNIGGSNTEEDVTVKIFYERERGTSTGNSNVYPSEWSSETDEGGKHNGIGLMYPSDYAYATGGGNLGREQCFAKELYKWDSTSENYQSECGGTDWLKTSSYLWTLTPVSAYSHLAFRVSYYGSVISNNGIYHAYGVFPVAYLTKSATITSGEGTLSEPYELSI